MNVLTFETDDKESVGQDKLQLEAYMRLYNVNHGALEEEYNSEVSAKWIEKNDEFWNMCVSCLFGELKNVGM